MEGDPLNKVIAMVVAAIVGLVMVVGAFLPIAQSQISSVTTIIGTSTVITGGAAGIQALLSVVVIMVIVGLIVGIVYYIRSDR